MGSLQKLLLQLRRLHAELPVTLALIAAASGCFDPDLREGLACSELENCPPGQFCDLEQQLCVSLSAPNIPVIETVFPHATGWIDEDDQPIRITMVPPPAGILECRTGPASMIGALDFAPCDGGDGTQPFHEPLPDPMFEEGSYETHIRTRLDDSVSSLLVYPFYAHRSLDRVPRCPSAIDDSEVLQASEQLLLATGPFPDDIQLLPPFVELPFTAVIITAGMAGSGHWSPTIVDYRVEPLSLRRRFVLNDAGDRLLVVREYESRQAREFQDQHICRNGFRFGNTPDPNMARPNDRRTHDCQYFVLNSRGQSVCLTANGGELALGPPSDIGWVKLNARPSFSPKGRNECPGCDFYLLLPP